MATKRAQKVQQAGGVSEKWLFAVGCALVLLPVIVALQAPTVLISAALFLRLVAAIGGALVGAVIPGVLQIDIPMIKGAGGLALFALVWATNPPASSAQLANPIKAVAPSSIQVSSSRRIQSWLLRGQRRLDVQRVIVLQDWMRASGLRELPLEVLLNDGSSRLESERQRAIADLNIP